MNAIRVLKHIDSDVVHIPELREMMGRDVEITIRERASAGGDDEPLETRETFLGDAAHRPPPDAEEMAELRRLAETDPVLASALEFSESVRVDTEAIIRLRTTA